MVAQPTPSRVPPRRPRGRPCRPAGRPRPRWVSTARERSQPPARSRSAPTGRLTTRQRLACANTALPAGHRSAGHAPAPRGGRAGCSHAAAHAADHRGRGLDGEPPLAIHDLSRHDLQTVQVQQQRPRRTTLVTHLGPLLQTCAGSGLRPFLATSPSVVHPDHAFRSPNRPCLSHRPSLTYGGLSRHQRPTPEQAPRLRAGHGLLTRPSRRPRPWRAAAGPSWLSRGRRPIVRQQATRRWPAINRRLTLLASSRCCPGGRSATRCCQAGRRVRRLSGPMLSVSSDRWRALALLP